MAWTSRRPPRPPPASPLSSPISSHDPRPPPDLRARAPRRRGGRRGPGGSPGGHDLGPDPPHRGGPGLWSVPQRRGHPHAQLRGPRRPTARRVPRRSARRPHGIRHGHGLRLRSDGGRAPRRNLRGHHSHRRPSALADRRAGHWRARRAPGRARARRAVGDRRVRVPVLPRPRALRTDRDDPGRTRRPTCGAADVPDRRSAHRAHGRPRVHRRGADRRSPASAPMSSTRRSCPWWATDPAPSSS